MSVCVRCNSDHGESSLCTFLAYDVDAFGNVSQLRAQTPPDPREVLESLKVHVRANRTAEQMRSNPESPLTLY
jgi:hypothetical protein